MDATRFEQHLIVLKGALSARRDGFAEPVVVMHQRILRHFAGTGEPPTAETVRAWSGELDVDPVEALEQLVKADLVEADPVTVRVVGAYPFVGESRGHEVHIADGPRVHTYCAVDALGVPAMLGRPVTISSRDPHTGDEVSITIDDGDASWAPQGAVASVPADAVDRTVAPAEEIETSASAGDTVCPTVNFYRDADTAAAYAAEHGLELEILTIGQAMSAANAVFSDLL